MCSLLGVYQVCQGNPQLVERHLLQRDNSYIQDGGLAHQCIVARAALRLIEKICGHEDCHFVPRPPEMIDQVVGLVHGIHKAVSVLLVMNVEHGTERLAGDKAQPVAFPHDKIDLIFPGITLHGPSHCLAEHRLIGASCHSRQPSQFLKPPSGQIAATLSLADFVTVLLPQDDAVPQQVLYQGMALWRQGFRHDLDVAEEGIGVSQDPVPHLLESPVVGSDDLCHVRPILHLLRIVGLPLEPCMARLQNAFNRGPGHGKHMPQIMGISKGQVRVMGYPVSELVGRVEAPPIAEAMSWVRQGPRNRDLINLCQAVPSYPPALELQQEFGRVALLPGTGGYTDIYGLPALRAAYAAHVSADYAAMIPADHVAITTGCNQAFAAAVMAVAKAGDDVVIPVPYYFNHQMWLTMLGVGINGIPAFAPGRSHPSPEDAAAAITPRTKAIILCTPNNPTGAVYPAEVIASFFELAKARGIALILDETYKDFRPDPAPAHGLFQRSDWQNTLIQLYSFSKVYALAGYRLGAMTAGPAILAEAAKILDCMTICPPQITQQGVIFALAELDAWKRGKLEMMAGRLNAIRQAFQTPGLGYELISSGAYFAYVRHPFRGQASKAVAMKLAQEHDVLCLPGSMFGPGQEDYLRLAFANVDAAVMAPLVERLLVTQNAL